MYALAGPRTVREALDALLLPGAPYSMRRLLDAMLALPQFGDPDRDAFHEFHPKRAVIGNLTLWTYDEARKIIDHAFGPEGHDHLKHAVATYRDKPVPELDEIFFLRIGLLLRGGWTQDDHWIWFANGDHVRLDLAAGWVGSWGLDSLNACVAAGLGVEELDAILDAGALPDPEAIATLVGLRPRS